jgi:hypothetical protein
MVWRRLRGQGREQEEWVSLFPLLRVVILRTAIAAEEAAVSENKADWRHERLSTNMSAGPIGKRRPH